MLEVISVEYDGGYRLEVVLSDGSSGVVDMEGLLWGPVFSSLKDPAKFRDFSLSRDFGTIVWGNGADVAPEWIKEHMKGRVVSKVAEPKERYG